MTPAELADQNLRHLCAVLGAAYSPDHKSWSPMNDCSYPGPWVRISLDGATYYISVEYIMKEAGARRCGTCYYIYPSLQDSNTPFAEKIASALLLLKNNPALFDEWVKQDGPHA